MRIFELCLLALFLCSTDLYAEESFRLIELKLDGGQVANVAWNKQEVTYGYVREPTVFPGNLPKSNCGRMDAIELLFDRNPGLDRDLFDAQVSAAFAMWEAVIPVSFAYTPETEKADILIGVQERPKRVAFTDLQFDVDTPGRFKQLRKGAICLNAELAWHTRGGGSDVEPGVLYAVAHEAGHVIGLDHPKSPMALMHFEFNKERAKLGVSDIRAAQELYASMFALWK